ncbi:hypothetical protein ACIOYV_23530, partial [Pseudomonas sp. NPDC087342]
WVVLFGVAMLYFVPRLGKVGQEQANARSMMTLVSLAPQKGQCMVAGNKKREGHGSASPWQDKP